MPSASLSQFFAASRCASLTGGRRCHRRPEPATDGIITTFDNLLVMTAVQGPDGVSVSKGSDNAPVRLRTRGQ
jgi:hypothetical protein